MVQPGASGVGDRVKHTKLTKHELPDFARRQPLRPPAEALAIIEPWVRTDGNAVSHRQCNAGSHGVRVTGVKSAGNVGGAHQWQQRGIGFRGSFADVSVQIELSHPPRFSQALDRSNEAAWSSDESFPASKMLQRSARDPAMVQIAAAVDSDRSMRPW